MKALAIAILIVAMASMAHAACREGENCNNTTQYTVASVSVLYVQTTTGNVAMQPFGDPNDCQAAATMINATIPDIVTKGKKGVVTTPGVTAFCLPSTKLYIIQGGYGSN